MARLLDLDSKSGSRKEERELVVLFFLQMEGNRTISELTEIINRHSEKIGAKVTEQGVNESITDLSRKGLVALVLSGNTGPLKDGEDRTPKYGLAKPAFSNNIEVAQLAVLIPTIRKSLTEDTRVLLETEINSGMSKNRGYSDTHILEMDVKVTIPIRGTMATTTSPITGKDAVKGEQFSVLYRADAQGRDVMIPHYWVKGFFSNNMKAVTNSNNLQHLAAEDVVVEDVTPVILYDPIICDGQGRGVAINEAIPAGTKFTMCVSYPVQGGYCSVDQTDRLMKMMRRMPRVGLGKNNKRWGRVIVDGYRLIRESDGKTVAEKDFTVQP